MTRRKEHRFRHNAESPYVIEVGKPLYKTIRGRWRADYFRNDRPLVLELACGKGEYTVGLAQVYPDMNFIGVDIKGDRIARGALQAQRLGLPNAAFLRTDINFIDEFFEPGEVQEIWITFPDPQPRPRQEKHRLTHPRFLAIYKRLLAPGGTFHLKTDSSALFSYTLDQLTNDNCFYDLQYTTNVYSSQMNDLHFNIVTNYETIFYNRGFSINYLQCKTGVEK